MEDTRAEFIHSEEYFNFMECYIYFGPHSAHECPKLVKVAALDTDEDGDADSPSSINPLHFIGVF